MGLFEGLFGGKKQEKPAKPGDKVEHKSTGQSGTVRSQGGQFILAESDTKPKTVLFDSTNEFEKKE